MNERTPKPHPEMKEKSMFTQLNKKIVNFVDTVRVMGETEREHGSNDRVVWIPTRMSAEDVQTKLEESELSGLLVPDSFFESSHVDKSNLKKAMLRVRWSEWERGISIKLQYKEKKNKLVARQLVSVTTKLERLDKPPEVKRTFVPSDADGEAFDDDGMRLYVLADDRDPISAEELYKKVKGTPEQVLGLLGLSQEIVDQRKEL